MSVLQSFSSVLLLSGEELIVSSRFDEGLLVGGAQRNLCSGLLDVRYFLLFSKVFHEPIAWGGEMRLMECAYCLPNWVACPELVGGDESACWYEGVWSDDCSSLDDDTFEND